MIENTNYFWNLIKRAQTGQKRPFEELTGFYYKTVYTDALRLIGNINSAEIITSDVFIRAWEHIKYLNESSPFNLWLKGLTISVTSSYYQREKKKICKEKQNVESTSKNDDRFLSLTARQRLVLILHDLEGYSIPDCVMMLNENKESELINDLDYARKQFIVSEVISLLNSYESEDWRKLTQDFEFWFEEFEASDQLNENLKILKSYRELLTNLLKEIQPSEAALNGLKRRLSDDSKHDAIETQRQQEALRKELIEQEEIRQSQSNSDKGVVFSTPEAEKNKLTEEVAEIFSNPDGAKEAYSKKLRIARKQKKFVRNLSYVIGVMNAIVIFYIASNISHNVTWVQNTGLTKVQAGNSSSELSVGDLIETSTEENIDISVQSVGNIKMMPNSKIKILNQEVNNNEIELLEGKISLTTETYFNRLSINIGKTKIKDYGSSSIIINSPKTNETEVRVKSGLVHVINDGSVLPLTTDYICDFKRGITYHKDVTPAYVVNLSNYISNPVLSDELFHIISASKRKDALTLWMLLNHSDRNSSIKILKKLNELLTIPVELKTEDIIEDRNDSLKLLLEEIEWQLY